MRESDRQGSWRDKAETESMIELGTLSLFIIININEENEKGKPLFLKSRSYNHEQRKGLRSDPPQMFQKLIRVTEEGTYQPAKILRNQNQRRGQKENQSSQVNFNQKKEATLGK